jgi:hypothetical protein
MDIRNTRSLDANTYAFIIWPTNSPLCFNDSAAIAFGNKNGFACLSDALGL